MIPKVIFNVWMGYGVQDRLYVDKWKTVCKNYDIVDVTTDNCEIKDKWYKKCIEEENWINASGYARTWYLHKYGGIYMDNDVEVIKSFNPLLKRDKLIVGAEDDLRINNAVMLSPKKNKILERFLIAMSRLPTNTRPDIASPQLLTDVIRDGITPVSHLVDVLPPRYFYPYHYTKEFTNECVTDDTYCIHRWHASWLK